MTPESSIIFTRRGSPPSARATYRALEDGAAVPLADQRAPAQQSPVLRALQVFRNRRAAVRSPRHNSQSMWPDCLRPPPAEEHAPGHADRRNFVDCGVRRVHGCKKIAFAEPQILERPYRAARLHDFYPCVGLIARCSSARSSCTAGLRKVAQVRNLRVRWPPAVNSEQLDR